MAFFAAISRKQGNRNKWEPLYRDYYVKISPVLDVCRYCGETSAETVMNWDHCPNLSWVHSLGVDTITSGGVQMLLVPSCKSCNMLLSTCTLMTINERKLFIADKLEEKYVGLLAMPRWGTGEINDLRGALKRWMVGQKKKKYRILSRIFFARGMQWELENILKSDSV